MLPVALAALPLLLAGCFDVPPDPRSGIPVFYDGGFSTGYTPASFDPKQGAVTSALSIDKTVAYSGTSSIRLDIPSQSSGFAGGVVLADKPQDLSSANALVFWTKATKDTTFSDVGFGLNFDPYPTVYQTTVFDLPLTTEWTRHLVPIPDPARLTAERGVFWYEDVEPLGYIAWFDDVKFDHVDPAQIALQPSIASYGAVVGLGGRATVDLSLSYSDFDGTVRAVNSAASPDSGPAPAFFSFVSSNPDVAAVDSRGNITGVLAGNAIITAKLGSLDVSGAVTVDVRSVVPTAPEAAAPVPTVAAGNVIALYNSKNVYTNRPVATWGTPWSNAMGPPLNYPQDPRQTTFTIPTTTSTVKKYTELIYVGVDFSGSRIDASGMTTLHVDVWTPDATQFGVKLVGWDAGVQGVEARVDFTSRTIRKFTWNSLEIPLSKFVNADLTRVNLASLGLLLWLDDATVSKNPDGSVKFEKATYFIDNVYFHN
jgi:hypothetical protein